MREAIIHSGWAMLKDTNSRAVARMMVPRMMDLVADEYENAQPTKRPEEMVEWLKAFHMQMAERLHKGEDVLDLIPE